MSPERIELWEDEATNAIEQDSPGAEDRPHLIRYAPKTSAGSAMIVCPGGGYARRAAHEGEPVARWLAGLGITSYVLHYRVSPHRHPAPLEDARCAMRIVREHAERFGYAKNKIGILGFSAGGHLAAATAILDDNTEADTRPDLMVLCYPVVSMVAVPHVGSRRNLLGDDASEELLQRLSLEKQVGPHTPPAFIWHTSDDAGVPVEHSLRLAAALSRHQVPFELHSFESGKHGLGLAEDHPQVKSWTHLCERWLHARGFIVIS